MGADEFETWWEAYKVTHSVAGYAKAVAREAWYAGKVQGMEAEAALRDLVEETEKLGLYAQGNERARLQRTALKADEGICDACSATVRMDELYIISTPQLAGVAMCMVCRIKGGPYCEVPPTGWWCSRLPNHEGPCAARPDDGLLCRSCKQKRCLCQLDLFAALDDG